MPADPRLDRLVEFDERSRGYPIRELVAGQIPRSYTWGCDVVLDQGNEGACVGFAWTHEIRARPKVSTVNTQLAYGIYDLARDLDEWPGDDYDGTSVLAGVKAAQSKGYYGVYRWAFSLEDLILAVGHHGPAVLGIKWREGMMDTDSKGWVHNDGEELGGHAILLRGVNITGRYGRIHNSWGPSWGVGGTAKVSFDDLEALLDDEGEACIPEQRYVVEA